MQHENGSNKEEKGTDMKTKTRSTGRMGFVAGSDNDYNVSNVYISDTS
jgi:hypothetical protein